MIQLICGDCIDILDGMAKRTKNFNMIFVDPPFTEWHASDCGKFNKSNMLKFTYNINRLLADNGVVWLWGYIPQLIEDWKYWSKWFKCVFDMVRIKPNIYPPPVSIHMPTRAHENIWCLIKRDAKITETKLLFRKRSIVVREKEKTGVMRQNGRPKRFKEYKTKVFITSYLTYPSVGKNSKEYYGHPTQKPVKLVETLIKSSTDKGDWILDPFAGSGSTLIAAMRTERNCIGIEINPEYCKIIKKRIEHEKQMERWKSWAST